jgi:hypothetical protein
MFNFTPCQYIFKAINISRAYIFTYKCDHSFFREDKKLKMKLSMILKNQLHLFARRESSWNLVWVEINNFRNNCLFSLMSRLSRLSYSHLTTDIKTDQCHAYLPMYMYMHICDRSLILTSRCDNIRLSAGIISFCEVMLRSWHSNKIATSCLTRCFRIWSNWFGNGWWLKTFDSLAASNLGWQFWTISTLFGFHLRRKTIL